MSNEITTKEEVIETKEIDKGKVPFVLGIVSSGCALGYLVAVILSSFLIAIGVVLITLIITLPLGILICTLVAIVETLLALAGTITGVLSIVFTFKNKVDVSSGRGLVGFILGLVGLTLSGFFVFKFIAKKIFKVTF